MRSKINYVREALFSDNKKQICASYLWQLSQAIFAKFFHVNFVDLIERYFFASLIESLLPIVHPVHQLLQHTACTDFIFGLDFI